MRRTLILKKNPDAGKDWRQEEKGMTEDEMAAWHHQLNAHKFESTLGIGDGQGGLMSCRQWGCKELDTTEWLKWTEMNWEGFSVKPWSLLSKWFVFLPKEAIIESKRKHLSPVLTYWRQEAKGMTEEGMVGWHHPLNGHEFEWALGIGDGQGGLVCCSPRGRKESDTTEWLNNYLKCG